LPVTISTALLINEEGTLIGAVESFRDISREEDLRKKPEERYTCQDIVSQSHKMQVLFDLLPDIAASPSTVLLQGKSGTGKELVAWAIHQLSSRNKRAFVAVNCAALPDTLLEAELFGYRAGAFTDAKKDEPDRFKLADRGTLFLDEIGDVTPAMQVRLLRVLQEKTYEPLGGVESICHDARIIAASNRDLQELVREGKFREDLYYRINVLKLLLPPLRERMKDIPLLVDHSEKRPARISLVRQGKHNLGGAAGTIFLPGCRGGLPCQRSQEKRLASHPDGPGTRHPREHPLSQDQIPGNHNTPTGRFIIRYGPAQNQSLNCINATITIQYSRIYATLTVITAASIIRYVFYIIDYYYIVLPQACPLLCPCNL